MYVGIFGDVIFSVGHLRVLTPSNFKGTTGANWAEHEVLGGKARAEYTARTLQSKGIRHIFGKRGQTLKSARIMSLQAISNRPL